MGTDLRQRMAANRKRREQAAAKQNEIRAHWKAYVDPSGFLKTDKGEEIFIIDLLPIELHHITFNFGKTGISSHVLLNVCISLKQGKLHAFVGPPREGKATLLKLVGQVLLPQERGGDIFIPSHLRVLHVSAETRLLDATFLGNVIFNHNPAYYGGMERVIAICQDLQFAPELINLLEADHGAVLDKKSDSSRAQATLNSWRE